MLGTTCMLVMRIHARKRYYFRRRKRHVGRTCQALSK